MMSLYKAMYALAAAELAFSVLSISVICAIAIARRSGGKRVLVYSFEFLLILGYLNFLARWPVEIRERFQFFMYSNLLWALGPMSIEPILIEWHAIVDPNEWAAPTPEGTARRHRNWRACMIAVGAALVMWNATLYRLYWYAEHFGFG